MLVGFTETAPFPAAVAISSRKSSGGQVEFVQDLAAEAFEFVAANNRCDAWATHTLTSEEWAAFYQALDRTGTFLKTVRSDLHV